MIGRDVFMLDAAREATDDEVLTSFLEQYYSRATAIPGQITSPGVPRRRDTTVHGGLPDRGPRRTVDLRVPSSARSAS